MAKFLLWIFVTFQFLTIVLLTSNGAEADWKSKALMWLVIGVLAICESIEKSKEVK